MEGTDSLIPLQNCPGGSQERRYVTAGWVNTRLLASAERIVSQVK